MKKKIVEDTIDDEIELIADVPEEDIDTDDLDETAASDSIKTHDVPSRLDIMTNTVSHMAKMGNEELTKWFRQAIDTSSKYASTGKDSSGSNKASINMKPSGTGANPMGPLPFVPVTKEDLDVVFDAMGLTEDDLKAKTITLFEAALNARLVLEATR